MPNTTLNDQIKDPPFALESQRIGLPRVWMYGGGRQSAAIAVLIKRGELPIPEYATIADTGREKRSTWDYLRDVVQPALPFKIHIVPKAEFATVDLWGGEDGKTLLIPAYTNESGEIGKLPNFCSNEWKVRVVERWLRRRGVGAFQSWIGFSKDEPRRWIKMKEARGEYVFFPLVESRPTTAAQAVELVKSEGWPEPIHSSCWMCPNMQDDEWSELPPDELEQAAVMDEQIRLIDRHAFLHSSCQPLRSVTFQKSKDGARPCDSGVCFV